MTAHLTRTDEEKLKLAAEVIAYLNEVVGLDREALHVLMETRVTCNEELSQHTTTQVAEGVGGHDIVGLLGILNGLVGVRADGWGYITGVYDDNGKLTHFEPSKERPQIVEVEAKLHPDVGTKPVPDVDASMLINGNRRKFVERVQYYLNELLEDDNPQHVIGHIEHECADYTRLIRDAVKVYGTGYPKP